MVETERERVRAFPRGVEKCEMGREYMYVHVKKTLMIAYWRVSLPAKSFCVNARDSNQSLCSYVFRVVCVSHSDNHYVHLCCVVALGSIYSVFTNRSDKF